MTTSTTAQDRRAVQYGHNFRGLSVTRDERVAAEAKDSVEESDYAAMLRQAMEEIS